MPLSLKCPHCSVILAVPDQLAGKSVRCSKCGKAFGVPAATPAKVAAAAIQAKPNPAPARAPLPARPSASRPATVVTATPPLPQASPAPTASRPVAPPLSAIRLNAKSHFANKVVISASAGLVAVVVLVVGGYFLLFRGGAPGPGVVQVDKVDVKDEDTPMAPLVPVALTEAKRLPLPAPAADMVVGGAGRFLVLHLPQVRKAAVVDVTAAKISHYVPVPDNTARVAAGLDKLVVVLFDKKKIQRWKLDKEEMELEVDLPADHAKPGNIALGAASQGPILVGAGPKFYDLATLKPLPITIQRAVPWASAHAEESMPVRAAANGQSFGFWTINRNGGQLLFSMAINGPTAQENITGDGTGHVMPSADGRTIYTGRGLFTSEIKLAPGNDRQVSYGLPAHQPGFWLKVKEVGKLTSPIQLFLDGDKEPFTTVEGVELPPTDAGAETAFSADRKIVFLPFYHLLVTLPREDALVLNPIRVDDHLKQANKDYLVVVSPQFRTVERGQALRHTLVAQTRQGPAKFKLEAGPKGMEVTPAGRLQWTPPKDFPDAQADVIVHSQAGGLEALHTLRVQVSGDLPVIVAAKPADKPDPKVAADKRPISKEPAPGWNEYKSKDGIFAAQFPVPPKIEAETMMADLPDGANLEVSFLAGLPKLESLAAEFFLKKMFEDKFGPVAGLRKVEVQGHAGQEGILKKGDESVHIRMVSVGDRLYQLVVVPSPKSDAKLVATFFGSFKVLSAPAAKAAPPVAILPGVPGKSNRAQAIEWVEKNNAFGPEHKIVKDIEAHIDSLPPGGHGFRFEFGANLVKSKKATWVLGWRRGLWIFELTSEQALSAKMEPSVLGKTKLNSPEDGGEVPPDFDVAVPIFDAGTNLPMDKEITGRLPFHLLDRQAGGYPSIRLSYWIGNTRHTSYSHYLSKFVGKDDKEFKFKYRSPMESEVTEAGPVIFIMDIVEFGDDQRTGQPFVVSNPVAVLMNFGTGK